MKLKGCQCVSKSDFKAGSGPGSVDRVGGWLAGECVIIRIKERSKEIEKLKNKERLDWLVGGGGWLAGWGCVNGCVSE